MSNVQITTRLHVLIVTEQTYIYLSVILGMKMFEILKIQLSEPLRQREGGDESEVWGWWRGWGAN